MPIPSPVALKVAPIVPVDGASTRELLFVPINAVDELLCSNLSTSALLLEVILAGTLAPLT